MKMDPGLDTGPILAQQRLPILPLDTAETLSHKLAVLAAKTLSEYLPVYLRGELPPHPQEESLASYAPQLKKEDGRLDFLQTAELLQRKVRAFYPWPGAFSMWKGQPLKILEAQVEPCRDQTLPGTVTEVGRWPAVQAGDGLLILRTVQPAGKRPMEGEVFLRGARDFPGAVLE